MGSWLIRFNSFPLLFTALSTSLIFALAFSISGCSKKKEEVEVKEVVRPVKLLTVGGKSTRKEIKYPGRIRASERVDLAFQVAGLVLVRDRAAVHGQHELGWMSD